MPSAWRRTRVGAHLGGRHHEAVLEEHASPPSDRAVGLVIAAGLMVVGLAPLLKGRGARSPALVIAAVLVLLALARPRWLHPVNRAWMAFGAVANRFVTAGLMTMIFCAVVAPLAWVLRRCGHDPLRLKFEPRAETYWIERRPPGPAPETMRNQF